MEKSGPVSSVASMWHAICPTCGQATSRRLFEKFTDQYYQCSNCCLVFVYPRPSVDELSSRYDEYGRDYYSDPKIIECFFAPHKVERELRFLTRVAPKGTLLDVGCSMGAFVKAAIGRGYNACGIDICAPAIQLGQASALPVTCGDLFSFDRSRKFDVITMWATLEHVPNPNDFMLRIRELLHPGGVLAASVPNHSSLTQRILGPKDRYVGRDHLNWWTARAFVRYFSKHDFTPVAVATWGFNPLAIIKDLRNRDTPLGCKEMIGEQTVSHQLKSTPLVHALRAVEATLDLFRAGDVIAVAGRRD